MIIDAILGRKDSLEYEPKSFYDVCLQYGKTGENIARAMDLGTEEDVKKALCQYLQDNEYNPLLIDYVNRINWLSTTDRAVEIAAANDFNEACRKREEAAEKMKAPEGKDSVFAFECGVLLTPEHEEYDFYANNNPGLPFGFYDENQGLFLQNKLGNELSQARDYVKNGVDNTYAVISFQGFVDIDSDYHNELLKGEFDVENVSYTFFKNSDEIVWSACKVDGQLIEGFLEKEIDKLQVPKDKIMLAVLDDENYAKRHLYSSDYSREVYTFDTPEEFVAKWQDLPEGSWYWAFDKGEIICSGALDPDDIELFEEHWGKSFDAPEYVELPERLMISARILALDTDSIYEDEEELSDIVSDYLSDEYGYCHKGFDMHVSYNEFGEPSVVTVTNIKWDVDDELEENSLDDKIALANEHKQECETNVGVREEKYR